MWHLWNDESPRPGWTNMSVDMALLDRAEQDGESWLRLYRWSPHCLSFGRHEPTQARFAVDRIRARGLDTVRRPTGGRSVWHAQELTYAVAAPCSQFGSLHDAYYEIHWLLKEALQSCGLAASLAPRAMVPAVTAGPCFLQAVGGEVLVNGRKVVGSAQFRQGTSLLQHGSILLCDEQHSVADLMTARPPLKASSVDSADCLGHLEMRDLAEAIATAASLRWRGTWKGVADPGDIMGDASRYYSRFQSAAWTWAR